jgi:hypothetical protein
MKVKNLGIAALVVFFTFSFLNLSAQTKTPRAAKRQINQQERIHQGVKSGQLTKRETKRLELQQRKIQKDKIKAKSNGVVTPRERTKLQAEQNRTSRNIYRKKHNLRTK